MPLQNLFKRLFLVTLLQTLCFANNAYTQIEALSEKPTQEFIQKYQKPVYLQFSNQTFYKKQDSEINKQLNTTSDWQPAADTSDFKYVLLSSEAGFSEAQNLRYKIAENLPVGVKLVLLVNTQQAQKVLKEYSRYISPDRIILARDTNIDGGFWARDAFPYPVVNAQKELSLVSAKYYRPFKASPALAQSLALNMQTYSFTFVGGNLIADEFGVCFTIDSYRKFTTTIEHLKQAYGCKEVHVLQHFAGIGDVDEVMKPIGNKKIITNRTEYVNEFKSLGYDVIMLPTLSGYRTYANSLIVGQTVFMPTYGIPTDSEAQKVYENLGYKVVGIRSNYLSDEMNGSVHCQTMAYPAIDEEKLLSALQLEKIN